MTIVLTFFNKELTYETLELDFGYDFMPDIVSFIYRSVYYSTKNAFFQSIHLPYNEKNLPTLQEVVTASVTECALAF